MMTRIIRDTPAGRNFRRRRGRAVSPLLMSWLLLMIVATAPKTTCASSFVPRGDGGVGVVGFAAASGGMTKTKTRDVTASGGIRNDIRPIRTSLASTTSSSDRLEKARMLLDEITSDKDDYDGERGGVDQTTTAAASVVPDTYWLNGHLLEQGSVRNANGGAMGNDDDSRNYVTRWARGVKVAEPLVKYDPVKAEKLLFRQPTKWLVRNFQIAYPFGFWVAGVAYDFLLSRLFDGPDNDNDEDEKDDKQTPRQGGGGAVATTTATKGGSSSSSSSSSRESRRRRARARQLTDIISNLGPAIIKGGQALSSRPDLLPSEYLEELQKLQDDVPRFSNDVAFRTVERELNLTDFNDVFELVSQEPVAAASIGQVYKAKLRDTGDVVALKIQRPNCEEVIALDLYVLRWWAGVYNGVFALFDRDVDLRSVIDDFGTLIYREIDYVAEAANAQRFNELYAADEMYNRDVFVPKVYSELTTSKVLTMEWVDGCRLTDRDILSNRYNLNESKLVDALVQCSLRQILENGFFHADPHAGNLLACPDGRLCYLDFGMMSYATRTQRNGFLLAVVHIVNRDWHELVRLYVKLGFIPEGTDLRPIEIALEDALPDVLNAEISELNFKNVINKLGDIMYTFPFSLPPFYIAIIRCLGVLEGLAIQVDPQARIINEAYPYVASRVLTDPQDELQEALRRLALTSDGRVRWGRLESLLEEARDSSGYDVTAALDLLTDYVISNDDDDDDHGGRLLSEISEQIVEAADALGAESVRYVLEASRALAIDDEVAAVRAFRSLQEIAGGAAAADAETDDRLDNVRARVGEGLRDVLPDPTPSMRRFFRILTLIGAQQQQQHGAGETKGGDRRRGGRRGRTTDPAKFVPIVRKLSQEPRVRRAASEIAARLGERALSRGLRAAFGLPPPTFGSSSAGTTVTEDKTK